MAAGFDRACIALASVALAIAVGGSAAPAQEPSAALPPPPQRLSDVQPGTRIVLHVRGASTTLPGTLVRINPDTIWMQRRGQADTSIVMTSILRDADVLRGSEDGNVRRGAVRGLLIGAGIGAAVGLAIASGDEEGADFMGGAPVMAAGMAVVGAVPGVIVGALAGGRRREIWVRVSVP